MSITNYLKELKRLHASTSKEHTYRTPLENLWNEYYKNSFSITQESSSDEGIPDFTIKNKSNQIIGFIECKDIDVAIEAVLDGKKSYKKEYEQLIKYLTIAPVVIYTNYISFYLITMQDDKIVIITKNILLEKISDKITLTKEIEAKLMDLLDQFTASKPQALKNQNTFIKQIAKQTRILNDEILIELGKNSEYFNGLQDLFNQTIFKELDDKDFAESFSQMITFALLFYRLTTSNNVDFNTFRAMPAYIPVFQEILDKFTPSDKNCTPIIYYAIGSIINSINSYDETMFKRDMSYKETHDTEDPFIYLYENFLKEFDAKTRKDRGVYYTPIVIVRYIIKSLDEILLHRLGLGQGLRHKDVHILDFATGTGTFLLGTIEHIYKELEQSNNQGLWQSQVSDFILKQLYGFEYMVVPYVLAHFRIHEYLNACQYEYQKDERLQLYLTNTLDHTEPMQDISYFPAIRREAVAAHKVKHSDQILIIMGNPPYNSSSQNIGDLGKKYRSKGARKGEKNITPDRRKHNFDMKLSPEKIKQFLAENPDISLKDMVNQNITKTIYDNIEVKLRDYKENLNEKKVNLDDDYIKFIRFAHWKMENIDKGIISIIVNNSFISGITHREMRNKLMQTFDEIYIFDLHGNINKGEKAPDGSQDFNVFDIASVGVCIVFFVKTGIKDNPNKGVYFQEIFGTQSYKKQYLMNRSWDGDNKDKKWLKLKDDPKWHWFVPRTANKEYWNDFIGLQEVFLTIGSGVKTDRDSLFIDKDSNTLQQRMSTLFLENHSNDFIRKYNIKNSSSYNLIDKISNNDLNIQNIQTVHYRPFDFQYIYYQVGITSRPAYNTMKHLINRDNVGLIFTRSFVEKTFQHISVTNKIIDIHVNSGQDYIALLYLYHDTNEGLSFSETKTPNFTKTFNDYRTNHSLLKDKTPEEILAYIYAVLYAPHYRTIYAEDLSYDYPRVPFTSDAKNFDELQKLGQELINIHLMKSIPPSTCGYPIAGDNVVDKPHFKDDKLYINKTQYLSPLSQEVWEYSIGGYQVLHKWLSARKEQKLSHEDIIHLQNVVFILTRTRELQSEIDTVYKEIT